MADIDAVIAKAKKLAALRDKAGSEHEAIAAANVLASFLEKHRLSMVEVEAASDGVEESFELSDKPLATYMRLPTWKRDLANTLCVHFGVANWERRYLVGHDRKGREQWRSEMRLCGKPSDVAMFRFMYGWLTGEANRLVSQLTNDRKFRNSWLYGFSMGIYEQLKRSREKAAEQASQEAGLVLQGRFKAALAFLNSEKPNMGSPGRRTDPDIDYFAAAIGFQRGKSQHLGQSLPEESKEPKALLPSAAEA